jgi:hypothetical protein
MSKIKNLISKYFGKITFLNSIYNQDLLTLTVLIIILSTLLKSKSIIKKLYKKFNSPINEKTEDKDGLNDIQINEISHSLEEDNIKKDNEGNKIEINNEQNDIKKSSKNGKNNIKIVYKKKDDEEKKKINQHSEPYSNNKKSLYKKYTEKIDNHEFSIDINSTICSTPIFNLRTYKDLDFHYNFLIHDFDPKKINNLIMCKDIHQWMSSSSLSNEDLTDGVMPIYFILQKNNAVDVLEYLKLFVQTDKNGVKIAFIQKGTDFLYLKKYIDELISKNLIKDLLQDKHFHNYNLSNHDDVLDFLNNLLSLVLISEELIGDKINLDIKNYHDNKNTFEYFFNIINSDAGVFNTTI